MNNYHTHTLRCKHAIGNEEDMVLAAISMGVKELGFSDHVPLPHLIGFSLKALFDQGFSMKNLKSAIGLVVYQGGRIRMSYRESKQHIKEVRRLEKKYENQIKIKLGFECEYFPNYLDYFKNLLDSKKVDYLIFGNHYHNYQLKGLYYGTNCPDPETVKRYQEDSIKGLRTGLFSCFAHPDLYLSGYKKWDEHARNCAIEICKVAKELDIPLELNASGVRVPKVMFAGKLNYRVPYDAFWEVAATYKNKVIIGMDAHAPGHLDETNYYIMKEYAKEKNLNLIDKIDI